MYNGSIHIVAGRWYNESNVNYGIYHYAWDGDVWTEYATPPLASLYRTNNTNVYVYHNNLFFRSCIWSDEDSTWTKLDVTEYPDGVLVIPFDDTEIHAIDSQTRKHYTNLGDTRYIGLIETF